MPITRWAQASRRLPLLFLGVMLIPALALGWLTLQLLERDRRVEAAQAEERVEHAADRVVAASHQRLSDLEGWLRRLSAGEVSTPPPRTVLVTVEGDRVTVAPTGGLVYRPILPTARRLAPEVFADGERLEYQAGDPARAIEWFRARARTDDPAVRAGALLRLGRNQRKAGQTEAALATYAELATLGATPVDGYPAALLARASRCGILEVAGRAAELAAEAGALRAHLSAGTWPLRRDQFDFYMQEARRWAGDTGDAEADRDARAIAAAFQSVWDEWVSRSHAPASRWLIAEARPVLLTATAGPGRLVVLLAGADYLRDEWSRVEGAHVLLVSGDGDTILGTAPARSAIQAVRAPDATRLPWTIRVTSTPSDADATDAALRRRLLIAGLAAVLLLLGGSAYFTLRGVTRELAVARLQSDFVSAVSHEFRTPLASVRHLSDMLSSGRVADEAKRQDCYDILSRESERLERLVENLLDFGRIESGAYRYRFERIEVAGLLRELVGEFQHRAAAQGHRVHVSIDGEPAVVRADREALSRAIWNLLDNAVKYSPGEDAIWVDLTSEGDTVAVRVRDRGLGIAASEREEIFGKFVRGSNARARQIKGTGIGLAMVRHIVEAHRGEVRVESEPNHGSTFALVLPVERPA